MTIAEAQRLLSLIDDLAVQASVAATESSARAKEAQQLLLQLTNADWTSNLLNQSQAKTSYMIEEAGKIVADAGIVSENVRRYSNILSA